MDSSYSDNYPSRSSLALYEWYSQEYIFIESEYCVLGRDGDVRSDLFFADTISRRHFEVSYTNGEWVITCIGQNPTVLVSNNDVFTTMEKNAPYPVFDGDLLRVCGQLFMVALLPAEYNNNWNAYSLPIGILHPYTSLFILDKYDLREYAISDGYCVIGREGDVYIDSLTRSSSISRRHLEILCVNDTWHISNIGRFGASIKKAGHDFFEELPFGVDCIIESGDEICLANAWIGQIQIGIITD